MYGQLVKQGKSGCSSPKFNGLRKTTGQNIKQGNNLQTVGYVLKANKSTEII